MSVRVYLWVRVGVFGERYFNVCVLGCGLVCGARVCLSALVCLCDIWYVCVFLRVSLCVCVCVCVCSREGRHVCLHMGTLRLVWPLRKSVWLHNNNILYL